MKNEVKPISSIEEHNKALDYLNNDEKEVETFVTTVDNPYDFFEQFELWLNFDIEKGYGTLNLFDRISQALFPKVSSLNLNKSQISEVLHEMVDVNPLTYKLVTNKNKLKTKEN